MMVAMAFAGDSTKSNRGQRESPSRTIAMTPKKS